MKKVILLGLIAVVAAGAAVYGLLFHQPSKSADIGNDNENEEMATTSEVEVDESFSGAGPLRSLLEQGKNLECVITYIPNEYEPAVTGTYFVSGVSVRGDFLVNSPELGGEVVSSIIMNDGMFYSWSVIGEKSYGVKTQIDVNGNMSSGASKPPVPQDARVEYTCDTWSPVDGSVFVPPSNVMFQDFGSLLETGMEYGTIYNEE